MSTTSMSPESGPSVSHSSPETYGDHQTQAQKEIELQRKRARDRKSQQAMRDRNKWMVQNLTEQVAFLTRSLDERMRDIGLLDARVGSLEAENSKLRAQNAALQLSMMGRSEPSGLQLPVRREPWQTPPLNSLPSCIADQILQNFITAERSENLDTNSATFQLKPNMASLLYKDERTEDEISNVVGDIVRSYTEIETLPRQVAVFYVMCVLFKWSVLLNKQSWDVMPEWLRPRKSQLLTPHAAWVDRIPWPSVREYLVRHPEITLDDFASTYSSSFLIKWDYDPAHVLITTSSGNFKDVSINPIFEEHIRKLQNWSVAEHFRKSFPEISLLIDQDTAII